MALSDEQMKRIEEEEYRKVARQRALKDTQVSAKLDAKVKLDKNIKSDNYGALRECYRDIKSILRKCIMSLWLVLSSVFGALSTVVIWGWGPLAALIAIGIVIATMDGPPEGTISGFKWLMVLVFYLLLVALLHGYIIWPKFSAPLHKKLWSKLGRINAGAIKYARWHQPSP